MPNTTAAQLAQLLQTLQQERQQHVAAIVEIDGVFTALGITAKPAVKRGRKPGSTNKAAKTETAAPKPAPVAAPAEPKAAGKKGRRPKAKDGLTGEQYLMKLLADEKLPTAEINRRWKASGRGGTADNLLGALVKNGKLKRTSIDGRGSEYAAK